MYRLRIQKPLEGPEHKTIGIYRWKWLAVFAAWRAIGPYDAAVIEEKAA